MSHIHLPIFVVGSARSGTSLMQSILRRQGGLAIAAETHYFDDLRPRIPDASSKLSEGDRKDVEDYFLALSHRSYGFGGDPEQSKVGRELLRTRADEFGGSADAYFEAHCRLDFMGGELTYASNWGEKTPRHAFRILEMAQAFPESKILFMLRDPRGVVCSYANWKTKEDRMDPSKKAESDKADEILAIERERIRRSYHPVVATLIWKAAVNAAFNAREVLGEDRVKILRYEDLCVSEKETLQDLWKWIGVEEIDKTAGIPMTNSSFGATIQKGGMSQEAMVRWKTVLPRKIQKQVARAAGKTLSRSGYEYDFSIIDSVRRPFDYLSAIPTVCSAVMANKSRFGNPIMYVARRARHMISG